MPQKLAFKPPLHFCRQWPNLVSTVARGLLVGAVLLGFVNVVRAVSVSEYQSNLKQAITALDTLLQTEEDESFSEFRKRFEDTVAAVRQALPETVTVDCGEEFCTVDNSWLHEELNAVQKAIDSDWEEPLTRVIEKLKSIEERVAELQEPSTYTSARATDKQRLSEILQRPEYQTTDRANSALVRLLNRFLRWISTFFERALPTESGTGARVIGIGTQILVIALALAVLAYVAKLLLPRLWRPQVRKRKAKAEPRIVLGERLEPEQSAVDLLSEAETLARSGQVRAAIRKAYIALLVELGDRKILSLAQHKTNRDYLRSLRAIPSLYPLMGGLTDSFERHWYGSVQATSEDWQSFREGYRTALQTKN